jgi:hypothetical protein
MVQHFVSLGPKSASNRAPCHDVASMATALMLSVTVVCLNQFQLTGFDQVRVASMWMHVGLIDHSFVPL